MSAAFIFIPGSRGPAIVEHLHIVRGEDVVKTAESVECILRGFFEKSVNTRWARINSPGWFGRKAVDRAGSDSIFFTIYKREGEYDTWPMWAFRWLSAYGEAEDRRRYRDEIFKEYVALFATGLDVYLPQKPFSGILRLDEFFGGDVPPQKPFPVNVTSS